MAKDSARQIRHMVIFSAIVVTGVALFWQHYGLNKRLSLNTNPLFDVATIDDRPVGGDSRARLTRIDDGYRMSCDLVKETYQWPFCQLSVEFNAAPSGLDLSGYDEIELDVSIEGPGDPSLRVYLRNFNPAYASISRENTYKVNELEYTTSTYDGFLTLSMDTFSVPSWWRIANDVDISLSQPEFSNVTRFELATGSVVEQGEYIITMRGVTLIGKHITQTQMMGLLLAMWVTLGLGIIAFGYIANWRKKAAYSQRKKMIDEIDEALGTDVNGPKYDPVTGLGTRRFLRSRIISLVEDSERNPASAILMEIDHHSDYYHQPSNIQESLLADLARLIKQNTRDKDISIRWHATQLIVICPATTTAQTIQLAEKIRTLCEETSWRDGLKITLSMGVTQHSHTSIKQFSETLTKALHRARNEGGNKTIALLNNDGQLEPKPFSG